MVSSPGPPASLQNTIALARPAAARGVIGLCHIIVLNMLGSHLSIAGGLVNALQQAQRLKMDCVQVFTRNQRQWSAAAIREADRKAWLDQLSAMGWDSTHDHAPGRVVSHNSYLINLASPDENLWMKSAVAQRLELDRCEALHIPYCVAHPGAHLGPPRAPGSPNDLERAPNRPEMAGLKRIIKALNAIHRDLRGYRAITCLETTVGSGTNLGYSFHQLAFIRAHVKQPQRVGFCFDTCHVTAAGYDMTTPQRASAVLEAWDDICGLDNLRVVHCNDSVGAVGSRRDRHAHIGEGACGRCCFRTILNHPGLAAVPKILETPKGVNARGLEWDVVNIRRLRRMTQPPVPADNEATAGDRGTARTKTASRHTAERRRNGT